MGGFKVICNECGNSVQVENDTSNKDYEVKKYSFYPIQTEAVGIYCSNCGNEVYIRD